MPDQGRFCLIILKGGYLIEKWEQNLLFLPVIQGVYAADGTGRIEAVLDTRTAKYAVKKKRARKISDNLIKYKKIWKDTPPLVLTEKILF